jgi:hypothetical protein
MALRRMRIRITLAGARLITAALRTRANLPKCLCPRHGGNQLPGISPACVCTDNADGTVTPVLACPYVTRQQERIVANAARTSFMVPISDQTYALLTAGEKSDCVTQDDAAYDQADED